MIKPQSSLSWVGGSPVFVASWRGMKPGSEDATKEYGEPISFPSASDRAVQVTGAVGSGGKIQIQGSMNGTDWVYLHDLLGQNLEISALGIYAILEPSLYIRPYCSAGDGATLLDVYILMRGVAG